jgi:hypothetical protein
MTDPYEREFAAMWDAQLLDYPTITRNEAGKWNYFAVTPARAQWTTEDRVPCTIDGLTDADVQTNQGEDLAIETLCIAAQNREADGVALQGVTQRAFEIYGTPRHPLFSVALGFVETILDAAVKGRGKAYEDMEWGRHFEAEERQRLSQ